MSFVELLGDLGLDFMLSLCIYILIFWFLVVIGVVFGFEVLFWSERVSKRVFRRREREGK